MQLFDFILIFISAIGAGIVNTIAGGGTFLTFPALVFIGIPPIIANATSALAVFPGYLSGAVGFRAELAAHPRRSLVKLSAVALLGGLTGGLLLLVSSDRVFAYLVPVLLLAATLVFLYGDKLRERLAAKSALKPKSHLLGLFLVAAYGGYFNGGLGIVLLALFALWGMQNIHAMNGLKNGLSFVISGISVGVFVLSGLISWPHAVVMMFGATIGGYLGAPVARAIPKTTIRLLIGVIGFLMSLIFFMQLF